MQGNHARHHAEPYVQDDHAQQKGPPTAADGVPQHARQGLADRPMNRYKAICASVCFPALAKRVSKTKGKCGGPSTPLDPSLSFLAPRQ